LMLSLCAALAGQTPSVTITWPAGAGSSTANTASFQVQDSTVSGGPYTTIGTVAYVSGQSTFSYTWTGGTCNTLYYFVIEAIGPSTAPGTSLPSPQVSATFPCPLPPTPGQPTVTVNP
jgi:hypothetical protein